MTGPLKRALRKQSDSCFSRAISAPRWKTVDRRAALSRRGRPGVASPVAEGIDTAAKGEATPNDPRRTRAIHLVTWATGPCSEKHGRVTRATETNGLVSCAAG